MYSILSSTRHNISGAVINNPNGKIVSNDNYIFHTCFDIVSGLTAVQIWGVHDVVHPVLFSQIVVESGVSNIRTNAYDNLYLHNNYLFVTCEVSRDNVAGGELVIVDVSDKTNPVIVHRYSVSDFPEMNRPTCILANDTHVYITSWSSSRLIVLDRSDLNNLVQITSISTAVNPFTMRFYKDGLITLTNNSAPSYFQVFDASIPASIHLQGQRQVQYSQNNWIHGHGVSPDKNLAIVTMMWNSTHCVTGIELINPSLPVWKDAYVLGSWTSPGADKRAGSVVILDTNSQNITYAYECGSFQGNLTRHVVQPTNDLNYSGSSYDINGTFVGGTTTDVFNTKRNFIVFLLSNEIILAGEDVLPPDLEQLPKITLIAPNLSTVHKTVNFSWNNYVFADSFSLQVATDIDFNNIVLDATGIINNNYSTNLLIEQQYFWRVKQHNSMFIDSEWSDIFSFNFLLNHKFYVNASGSNEYPFDTPAKGAINFYSLYYSVGGGRYNESNSDYLFLDDDIIEVVDDGVIDDYDSQIYLYFELRESFSFRTSIVIRSWQDNINKPVIRTSRYISMIQVFARSSNITSQCKIQNLRFLIDDDIHNEAPIIVHGRFDSNFEISGNEFLNTSVDSTIKMIDISWVSFPLGISILKNVFNSSVLSSIGIEYLCESSRLLPAINSFINIESNRFSVQYNDIKILSDVSVNLKSYNNVSIDSLDASINISSDINNSIIANNSISRCQSGIIMNGELTNSNIVNNIVVGFSVGVFITDVVSSIIDYNNVFGFTELYSTNIEVGSHSLSLDPKFVDDSCFLGRSKCIDAGVGNSLTSYLLPYNDIRDVERPQVILSQFVDDGTDIGAYEILLSEFTELDAPNNFVISLGLSEGSVNLNWDVVDVADGYIIERATNSSFSDSVIIYEGVNNFFIDAVNVTSTYFYHVRSYDQIGMSSWTDFDFIFVDISSINYKKIAVVLRNNRHVVKQLNAVNYPVSYDNKYFGTFATPGGDNESLNVPNAIAFDSKGNLFVCDYENKRIIKLNKSFVYVSELNVSNFVGKPCTIFYDLESNYLFVIGMKFHNINGNDIYGYLGIMKCLTDFSSVKYSNDLFGYHRRLNKQDLLYKPVSICKGFNDNEILIFGVKNIIHRTYETNISFSEIEEVDKIHCDEQISFKSVIRHSNGFIYLNNGNKIMKIKVSKIPSLFTKVKQGILNYHSTNSWVTKNNGIYSIKSIGSDLKLLKWTGDGEWQELMIMPSLNTGETYAASFLIYNDIYVYVNRPANMSLAPLIRGSGYLSKIRLDFSGLDFVHAFDFELHFYLANGNPKQIFSWAGNNVKFLGKYEWFNDGSQPIKLQLMTLYESTNYQVASFIDGLDIFNNGIEGTDKIVSSLQNSDALNVVSGGILNKFIWIDSYDVINVCDNITNKILNESIVSSTYYQGEIIAITNTLRVLRHSANNVVDKFWSEIIAPSISVSDLNCSFILHNDKLLVLVNNKSDNSGFVLNLKYVWGGQSTLTNVGSFPNVVNELNEIHPIGPFEEIVTNFNSEFGKGTYLIDKNYSDIWQFKFDDDYQDVGKYMIYTNVGDSNNLSKSLSCLREDFYGNLLIYDCNKKSLICLDSNLNYLSKLYSDSGNTVEDSFYDVSDFDVNYIGMPLLLNQMLIEKIESNNFIFWTPFSEPMHTIGYSPNVAKLDCSINMLKLNNFSLGEKIENASMILLSSSSGYTEVIMNDDLKIVGDITIAIYYKWNDALNTDGCLIDCSGEIGTSLEANNSIYNIQTISTGNIKVSHEYGNRIIESYITSAILPRDDQMHFIAVRRNSLLKRYEIRIDNLPFVFQSYINDPTGGSNSVLSIGGKLIDQADGKYCDAYIFNCVLSDLDIDIIYNTGSSDPTWFDYSNWNSLSGIGQVNWIPVS